MTEDKATAAAVLVPSSTNVDVVGDSIWPDDVAALVKLKVPKSWTKTCSSSSSRNNNTTKLCMLQYDSQERLLRVVDSVDQSIVLDIIDTDDMIGATIEISVIDTNDDNNDSPSPTIEETVVVNEQDETHRALNEPLLDTPIDRIGSATVTIYVYPRKNFNIPARSSRWKLWNSSSTSQIDQPQPTYERPVVVPTSTTGGPHSKYYGNRYANHRVFPIEPVEDFAQVQRLVRALQAIAMFNSSVTTSATTATPTTATAVGHNKKHYLLIVNPVSGPKHDGVRVCNEIVQPMIEEAGIDTTVIVTTHANHAREICSGSITNANDDDAIVDITKYNAIVLLGGDGIVHEVLNGIYERPDTDSILKTIPFGVVGCGTSNGMAITLAYASNEHYGPIDETYLIVKGQFSSIDISKVEILVQSEQQLSTASSTPPPATSSPYNIKQYVSNLTFSWAFVSDVDLESECIHWLGASRYDLWAVLRIISLRRYKAKFSYLPPSTSTISGSNNTPVLPAITEPVPDTWTTIDDSFVLFWISHVTHASPSVVIAPDSKLNDGLFHVVLARGNVSRYRLLRMVMLVENGTHGTVPGCELIQCTAFRLEAANTERYRSKNNIDGEAVEDGIVQASVISDHVQMFHKT